MQAVSQPEEQHVCSLSAISLQCGEGSWLQSTICKRRREVVTSLVRLLG